MLTARYLRAGVLYALAFVALFAGLFVLASCDATGGVAQGTATPGRATSTIEPVTPRSTKIPATPTEEVVPEDDTPTPEEVATSTPRRKATATEAVEVPTEEPTEFPTEEPTATVEEVPTSESGYTLYTAEEGDWSLEYPSDWDFTEDPPNYQWISPSGEAFIQETYSEGVASNSTNEELAQLASTQFEASFDNYLESGQTEQRDGSYRLDFTFDAGGISWDGQAFVEGRQSNLYMLMLATTIDARDAGTFEDNIAHIISSYSVPQD